MVHNTPDVSQPKFYIVPWPPCSHILNPSLSSVSGIPCVFINNIATCAAPLRICGLVHQDCSVPQCSTIHGICPTLTRSPKIYHFILTRTKFHLPLLFSTNWHINVLHSHTTLLAISQLINNGCVRKIKWLSLWFILLTSFAFGWMACKPVETSGILKRLMISKWYRRVSEK